MEHKLTITVPEEVYQPLVDEALKQGRTPEEEASVRLQRSVPIRKNNRKGDITKFFGMFDSGDPDSSDNERIDADLAREYGDNHEDES